MVWNRRCLRVGNRGLTKPDMREFMRQRKHLRGFCISAIYEYQRRVIVRQRKPAKFLRVEWAVIIIEDHATAHHHDSCFVRLGNEESESISPRWHTPAFFDIKVQSMP